MWLFLTKKRKLLLRCRKNYWPAVVFTFCATFKRAKNKPKTEPPTISSRIYSSMDKLLSFQGKKLTNFFFHFARECKGKDVQLIINPRFYFTDTWKQLWNCCNVLVYMNPRCHLLVRWGQLLIRWKKWNGQNRPKKCSKPNFLFARSSRYNCQTFYEKNFPLHNPFKGPLFYIVKYIRLNIGPAVSPSVHQTLLPSPGCPISTSARHRLMPLWDWPPGSGSRGCTSSSAAAGCWGGSYPRSCPWFGSVKPKAPLLDLTLVGHQPWPPPLSLNSSFHFKDGSCKIVQLDGKLLSNLQTGLNHISNIYRKTWILFL